MTSCYKQREPLPRLRANQVASCYKAALAALVLALLLVAAGCAGDQKPSEVVLVTHDSFAISPSVKKAFEEENDLTLRILKAGDAGELVTRALLTAGNPEGDVLFGVDNNLLARTLEGDVFEEYSSPELASVAPELRAIDPSNRATPIDRGDVCLNYDRNWFTRLGGGDRILSMDDLRDPIFKDTLVVENPATSTPGLAFLLATIARYGDPEWQDYWRDLRRNDVLVVDGWEEAYNVRFSGSSGKGPRPIVVSYASSPPAEVIFRTPRPAAAPTGVIEDSCFRQIEFAGVLRGAKNEDGAGRLLDFMLSERFQSDIPLQMFVFPARRDTPLPPEFERFAVVPEDPLDLPPEQIEANRERWVDEWTDIVVR